MTVPQSANGSDTPDLARASATAPSGSSVGAALAWTGLGKYAGQALRWGSTLIAARLLLPSDYGLVGIAGLFSGLVAILAEFGVGTAALRMRAMEGEQLERLSGFALLTGAMATTITLLMAEPLALFFNQPRVELVVAVSSLSFLLGAAQTVPSALLQRHHRFKLLASIDFTNLALGATAVLVGASLGFGYWSLVMGPLLTGVVAVVWLNRCAPVRPRFPRLSEIREAAHFSAHVFMGRLTGYLLFTADFFVVGRVLGDSVLGSYQFAWSLSNMPNDQVNGLVARVSGAFYSRVQHDRSQVAAIFLNLLEIVAMISTPLTLGIALVAPEFVAAVFGDKWAAMIVPLQLLCVFNALRVISVLTPPALTMLGDVRFLVLISAVGLAYFPLCFYLVAQRYGAPGVAATWLIGYPPMLYLLVRRLLEQVPVTFSSLVAAMAPALIGSAAMAAAVHGTRWVMPMSVHVSLRLAVLIVAGAAAYLSVVFLVYPSRVRAALAFLRQRGE